MVKKVFKEVYINGIKIKIELTEEEAKTFPKRIVSTVRIKDKEVEAISSKSIFF